MSEIFRHTKKNVLKVIVTIFLEFSISISQYCCYDVGENKWWYRFCFYEDSAIWSKYFFAFDLDLVIFLFAFAAFRVIHDRK